ncbi:diacylglycerol kinase [Alkalicoccus urumqiensis]|uniref:Diacylglycerol kinase n=1 Tax=Alkalicoccus urumqiensis TaxID=1548213 RepID=A0A2P6MIV8_ALKUR|nr:diacylglycerol kinase [Alkalicoccus urumqiensis]PRO66221.1 diacylglycerol kinase [Alkalicoccus urumqiensis]
MVKRARVIYNPTSGREHIKRNLPMILETLELAGYEASTHATTGEDCARKAAKEACRRQFDFVVAAGGDGTIHEVVNGIAGEEYRPVLGLLPGGTTNDFARALHIPRNIEEACRVMAGGKKRAIDVGQVGKKYFINIAGAGTLTELTYEVPSRLKTMMGQMAYYIKGFEKLPRIKPTFVTIDHDNGTFEGDVMLFLVSNTNSVGGFEKLAPDAYLDDGLFDLIIVKKTNLGDVVRIAGAAMRGDHLDDERVVYLQSSEIHIQSEAKLQLNLDGELGGIMEDKFINLHRHIEMMVPDQEHRCLLADQED